MRHYLSRNFPDFVVAASQRRRSHTAVRAGQYSSAAGNKLFLVGHAVGTQNYICLPADGGVKFTLFTPQATLFKGNKQITTHYFSPNPAEGGAIRAAWQHSKDSSTVWGRVMDGHSSADPAYVAPGAIPWLLVTIVGVQPGAGAGDKLAETTFIQRVNTAGGVAPANGSA